MNFTSAVLTSLVFVAVAGCSKPTPEEQKKKEEAFAAAIASTLNASVTPPAGGTTAPAAAPGTILGTCANKEASSCKEISGVFGLAEEESCKGLDKSGVFTKGEKPCPTENVISRCESTGGEQRVTTYYYLIKSTPLAAQRESAKMVCGFTDGKYTETATAVAAAPAKKATAAPKPKK